MPRRHTKIWFHRHGIRVADRPFFGLTESQKENRFDTIQWHEREIFLSEILKHPSLLVRKRAERTNEAEMQLMIRAFKQGVDLAGVTLERLQKSKQWHKLPRAPAIYEHQPDPPGPAAGKASSGNAAAPQPAPHLAAPPVVGTYADLSKTLDALVARAAGVKPQPVKKDPPPRQEPGKAADIAQEAHSFAGASDDAAPPWPHQEKPAADEAPRFDVGLGAATGAIPEEPPRDAYEEALDRAAANIGAKAMLRDKAPEFPPPPPPDLDDIAKIREKLVRNGRVRLDVEALAVYLLAPSFFAIANDLNPERWQSTFLDSNALRLGCLASRQCGKSLLVALKATAFAACHPGSTILVLAPTLRQSNELLGKALAVVMNAGLKIAGNSQFQLILGGDKLTPGEGSRIVALPGSNEDSGASVRSYTADVLVLEEASFLKEDVISSVLPSIAARPKAQLIGISSAGIIGSYFHSVMTSPQSRWEKMVVTARMSGRFTPEQLDEMKHNLGAAKYAVEFECQWGTVGSSLFDAETMDAAFGNSLLDPSIAPELDAEAAFGHLDLEALFAARPFERKVA